MRSDGDRRGAEGSPVTRRVLLAASGVVLLTSAAAGAAGARARGAGTQPHPEAGGSASPPGSRSSAHPGLGAARPATSASARNLELARHEAPPRHAQPKLPYGQPMYTIQDGPKVVALTIDDGPSPVYTPQVLRILHQYGVTASFSMIGENAATYPEIAREVAAAGHMIVNHTWNHENLGSMKAAAVRDEISRATDAIHAATGKHPSMFRAPYGVWSPAVYRYCARAGLTPLDWSVDPRDWSRPGVRAIVRNIESNTRTGSIILEHDGGGNRSQTVAALKIWLPRLLDEGYQFTTP
jgi:peptidoglycan-N-acetylglucosamine deacetylase